ncbi:MAG: DNA recombination protein RmuC [Gemmatimonadales bacterium]
MTTAILALQGAIAILVIVLVLMYLRQSGGAGIKELSGQLSELRQRLDSVVRTQEGVPRALAEGTAEQLRSLADLREQLAHLSEATIRLESIGYSVTELQQLLKVPRLRGMLGELWLEELLRQMFPPGYYELQYGFKSGERVDAVLRLSGRLVPIDSKFPLEACQRMLSATGDVEERDRRAFHRALRSHIDDIADKYIKPDEGTYEFALMYIPAENVYYEAVIREAALEDGSSIVGYALDRKVIPVSPNTFYAYLAAILHGLRGLEVEDSTRDILASLGALQRKLEKFERAYELVGRHLTNALKQHDETTRQLGLIDQHIDTLTDVTVDEDR